MLRYGSIIMADDSEDYFGLKIANEGFWKALLQYSEFEEFHLFLPDVRREEFCKHHQKIIAAIDRPIRVKVIRINDLPDYLARETYTVFHIRDPLIQHIAHLRKAFCSKPFPITGITHSLGMDPAMKDFMNMVTSPVLACDSIICTSHSGKTAVEKIFSAAAQQAGDANKSNISYRGRLDVIPLGVETDDFGPLSQEEVRKRLGITTDKRIILCLGRITAAYKMDLYPLLLAIKELVAQKDFRDIVLMIAGAMGPDNRYFEGILNRAMELGLAENLIVTFNFTDEQKKSIYAACDIYVSLADNVQETFGIAPVEAMMSGKPVVLSDWNGYRDLIEDGKSGYLIPTYWGKCDETTSPISLYQIMEAHLSMAQSVAVDVDILVKRLAELLRNRQHRLKMGEAARRRALTLFSWPRVVSRYHSLLTELGEIAQKTPWTGPTREPGFLPYFETFNHYASKIISDDDWVKATKRGRRVAEGQEEPFVYQHLEGTIVPGMIMTILISAKKDIRVGELREKIREAERLFDYNLLWSMKYNLLKTVA